MVSRAVLDGVRVVSLTLRFSALPPQGAREGVRGEERKALRSPESPNAGLSRG